MVCLPDPINCDMFLEMPTVFLTMLLCSCFVSHFLIWSLQFEKRKIICHMLGNFFIRLPGFTCTNICARCFPIQVWITIDLNNWLPLSKLLPWASVKCIRLDTVLMRRRFPVTFHCGLIVIVLIAIFVTVLYLIQ